MAASFFHQQKIRCHICENDARASLLCKPLYCYDIILEGMRCYTLMWPGIPGLAVDGIYNNQIKPYAESLVNMIVYQFKELEYHLRFRRNRDIRAAEKNV